MVLVSLKYNRGGGGRNGVRKNRGKGAGGGGRGEDEGENGKLEKMGGKESVDEKGRVRGNIERDKKRYVGVEVREIEEGAEDEKGEKNSNNKQKPIKKSHTHIHTHKINKQTNTTGTITEKGHVYEV